jgi:hypothetical protein
MNTVKSFEELNIWQLSREFCKDIFRIINYENFKKDFRLKDQIRASSGSIMDNIPEKFPDDFLFMLEKQEFQALRSKISTAKFTKTRVLPKAFTEQGLYMLATILKSPQATQATLSIIRAFSKLRELSKTLINITQTTDESNLC